MSHPKRIQRKRERGWRLPENAVSITRPGVFGNPFTPQMMGNGELALKEFARWLDGESDDQWLELDERRVRLLARLPELRGKDLACFCHDGEPCHGDYLIELANGSTER